MKRSKYLPIGVLALALTGTGAIFATAQTVPANQDAAVAAADADAQVVRAHFRGDPEREHGDRRGGKHRKRGGHHGQPGGGDRGEMMRTLFEAVDADADGSVTQAEVDSYRAAKLAEVDVSGDGALSIDEFDTLYREFTRPRMVDMFQELDADGDGVISAKEMDTRASRMFERMDRDGDGVLTLHPRGGPRGAPEAESDD